MKQLHYWLIFAAAALLATAAVAWVSHTAIRLDEARRSARLTAAFEENVRLSLWRMENSIAPMIARESARPYAAYSSFHQPDRIYDRGNNELPNQGIFMPSPLLNTMVPGILFHFQVSPDGVLTSPEAPTGSFRDLSVNLYGNGPMIDAISVRLAELDRQLDRESLAKRLSSAPARIPPSPGREMPLRSRTADPDKNLPPPQAIGQQQAGAAQNKPAAMKQAEEQQQFAKNYQEWNARAQQIPNVMISPDIAQSQKAMPSRPAKGKAPVTAKQPGHPPVPADIRAQEGLLKPLWIGDSLVLARRVVLDGGEYIQGCILDWPGIRSQLLLLIRDLLPQADLLPADDARADLPSRTLAGLPVKLLPGNPAPGSTPEMSSSSPVPMILAVSWLCLFLALLAVALLLVGALSLSERRGAFVSAVTHELRTPLTTFRIYSEMLSSGMVPDESKRKQYLETLCAEGARLSHLVENVLSYSRIERGRQAGRIETVPVRAILERVAGRLSQRAAQAGMSLVVDAMDGADGIELRTDMTAVEQILFNLVDNASKYAAAAEDKRIHLVVSGNGRNATFRIRDHGPGVEPREARRLFRPFHKSAKHAAESAPGVGLGLSLSRRLARRMGGDLLICPDCRDGACFDLILPRETAAAKQLD